MRDYDTVRSHLLSGGERQAVAGAAAWILGFNARWQVGLIDHGLGNEATISLVQNRGEGYLSSGLVSCGATTG